MKTEKKELKKIEKDQGGDEATGNSQQLGLEHLTELVL